MTLWRGVVAGLVLVGLITTVGTVGYMITEDLPFLDALYTSVITISTVGFREPGTGFTPAGQILTIVIVVSGVGSLLYTATVGLELLVERLMGGDRRAKRLRKEVQLLDDHVIVCGFGRIGRNVWLELRRLGIPAVVVDQEPDPLEAAQAMGALVVEGNATQNEVLLDAGIRKARSVIACVRADSDNLVIVLSAKALRPDVPVIARASEAESEDKLRLAGADRVVAPQVVGAHRLARLVAQPHLADFVDLVVGGEVVEFAVEGCTVHEGSVMAGSTLRETDVRGHTGALVLGLQEGTGEVALNPDPDAVIRPGQNLVALGTLDQLAALRELAESE